MLEKQGYHSTTLDQVARAAGVSRQAVYLHFGSKAQLILALLEHVDRSGRLPGLLARVQASKSALGMLDGLVHIQATYGPDISSLASAIDAARPTEPDAEAAWTERMSARRAMAERIVAMLAAENRLRPEIDAETATDLLWTLTNVRFWRELVVDRGWSKKRYEKEVKALLRRALVAHARKRAV